MEQEQATPENTGHAAPEQVQAEQRPAENTQAAQPQAAQVAQPAKGPDPDKRPPHQEREMKPELVENMLKIPGVVDYLADRLGVNDLKLANAKAECRAAGFTDEEIADFGNTPDEIRKAANIAAKYKAQIAQAQPQPEANPALYAQVQRPAPPSNVITNDKLKEMTVQEMLLEMAKVDK